jgi:cytohesin
MLMTGKPDEKAQPGGGKLWRVNRAGLLYIAMFLVPVLLAAYFLRRGALEDAMRMALPSDNEMIRDLAFSWPCPVNVRRGGRTPLFWAVGARQTDVVERLLSKGADINAKDDNGRTPLHEAALSGDKEFVEILIAKGADVNAKDYFGKTPLRIAIERGSPSIADILRKAGAKE